MATKTGNPAKTSVSKREANSIYRSLKKSDKVTGLAKPNKDNPRSKRSLDHAIDDIYLQAHAHRNRLVTFYIIYTVIFSIFVAGLIVFQAAARTIDGKETIELIPQEALNLLVVGMFGQFISLLTIVTKKVWTFEPFLKHHLDYKNNGDQPKDHIAQ